MPRRQPRAVAARFAWVMTPRAIMSDPSPMRAGVMADGRSRNPERLQIVEPGYAGIVSPHACVVKIAAPTRSFAAR